MPFSIIDKNTNVFTRIQPHTHATIGLADATFLADNTDDYQTFVDAVGVGNCHIYVKPGVYNFDSNGTNGITPGVSLARFSNLNNIRVEGAGKATELYNSVVQTAEPIQYRSTLDFYYCDSVQVESMYLHGNQVDGESETNRSGMNLIFRRSTNVSARDIYSLDGLTAIQADFCDYINITDCFIYNNEHAVVLLYGKHATINNIHHDVKSVGIRTGFIQRSIFVGYCNNVTITNCVLRNFYTCGIFVRAEDAHTENCTNIAISNCVLDSTNVPTTIESIPILIQVDTGTKIVDGVNISNVKCKAAWGRAISLVASNSATTAGIIKNVHVSDSTFENTFDGYAARTVSNLAAATDIFENLTFVNCKFKGVKGSWFYNCKNLTFIDCEFEGTGAAASDHALSLDDINGLKLIRCKFKGNGGRDLRLGDNITAAYVWDCESVNGIVTKQATALVDFRRNINFGIFTGSDFEGWTASPVIWTYVSATSFLMIGDFTSQLAKGDKIKWKEGATQKYGYVISTALGGGNTTVTIVGDPVVNTTLTESSFSKASTPFGHPIWFTYAPVFTGFGVDPTVTARYKIEGRACTVVQYTTANGTSNAVGFTTSSPVTAAGGINTYAPAEVRDNSVTQTVPGKVEMAASAAVFTVYLDWSSATAWTAANQKRASFSITFQI